MAMNGATAAKSVASLTPCASSFPITTRRGDSAVSVISSSVCSMRSLRNALNAPSGTTASPRIVRHVISEHERPSAGRALAGQRVTCAEEGDEQPAKRHEPNDDMKSRPRTICRTSLTTMGLSQSLARSSREERLQPAHCTPLGDLDEQIFEAPRCANSRSGKPAPTSRPTSATCSSSPPLNSNCIRPLISCTFSARLLEQESLESIELPAAHRQDPALPHAAPDLLHRPRRQILSIMAMRSHISASSVRMCEQGAFGRQPPARGSACGIRCGREDRVRGRFVEDEQLRIVNQGPAERAETLRQARCRDPQLVDPHELDDVLDGAPPRIRAGRRRVKKSRYS